MSESLLVYAGIVKKSEVYSWSTNTAHNPDPRRNGGGHALSLGPKSYEDKIDHHCAVVYQPLEHASRETSNFSLIQI